MNHLLTHWTQCWIRIYMAWSGESRKGHFLQVLNSIFYLLVLTLLCSPGCLRSASNTFFHLGNSVKFFKHKGGFYWVLSHHNCARKLGSEFGAQKLCWNTTGYRDGRSGTMALGNVSHAMGQALLKLLLQPVERSVELHECMAWMYFCFMLFTG